MREKFVHPPPEVDMPETKVPFWRRWNWQKWRRAYISQNTDNRRAWVRYPCHVPTSLTPDVPDDDRRWSATVRNISLGGMSLLVDRWFESGTVLRVDLQTALQNTPQAVAVRVIHVSAQPDGTWALGCAFTRAPQEDAMKALQVENFKPKRPDKRAWVRFPCDAPASCRAAGEPDRWSAKLLNVSPAGLGLLVTRKFERSTVLDVDLAGPKDQPLRTIPIRVAHVKEYKNGGWILGCAFARKLTDDELSTLMAG